MGVQRWPKQWQNGAPAFWFSNGKDSFAIASAARVSMGPPQKLMRRAKAIPLINEDPTRILDHIVSGPELAFDEGVRARFLGEI